MRQLKHVNNIMINWSLNFTTKYQISYQNIQFIIKLVLELQVNNKMISQI